MLQQIRRNDIRRELNMYVPVCVQILCSLLFSKEVVGRGLNVLNVKLTKSILQIECSSYKIQNSSAQIPDVFN